MATDAAECPISIPGYFYRDHCKLLCKPAAWTDVFVFFLGNYVAHIATVNPRPGQSVAAAVIFPFMALLFPGSGITNAIKAISSLAIFAPTELQMAARAGALYMIVRKRPDADNSSPSVPESQTADVGRLAPLDGHRTKPGRDIEQSEVIELPQRGDVQSRDVAQNQITELRKGEAPELVQAVSTILHGVCRLPEGYSFLILDKKARFENDPEDETLPLPTRILHNATRLFRPRKMVRTSISCSYNAVRVIVAMVQLAYAIATLYRARGDQIAMYGYAAFGLTVAQYAWMSLLNLVGSLMCPQYSSMFLVESKDMRDLREKIKNQRKCDEFPLDGTVGRLTAEAEKDILNDWDEERNSKREEDRERHYTDIAGLCSGSVPIAIIGGLSRFSPGESALYQRVWTMMWLVFGFILGPTFGGVMTMAMSDREIRQDPPPVIQVLPLALIFAVPAIGGFVVVGQMIVEYGVCVRLS